VVFNMLVALPCIGVWTSRYVNSDYVFVCEVLCERKIVEFQVWCDELIDTMSCGSVVSYVIIELDSRRMEELVMPRILSQQ